MSDKKTADQQIKKQPLKIESEKPILENQPQDEKKTTTDYFKVADLAVDITKNANPSILDNLGVYRGPVFTAIMGYFVLNVLGWNFIADVFGIGLLVLCAVHKIIHMGSVKETLNTSINSAVDKTKEAFTRKKTGTAAAPVQEKEETKVK